MNIKKVLSMVVALAMVLTVVPMFGITAGAADDIVFDDTTLVYDSNSYEGTETAFATGDNIAWFAVQFDLADISAYKDFAITDSEGTGIVGLCDAWFSNDGFYAFDGERSITVNQSTNEVSGNIKYNDYSGVATVRVLFEKTDTGYNVTVTETTTNKEFASTEKTGTAKGISLPSEWLYSGWGSGITAETSGDAFKNIKIYAGEYAETVKSVTATYTAGGETVDTVTKTYDTATGATGVEFPAKSYSVDGSNVLYYTAGTTLSESDVIVMDAVENPDVNGYLNGATAAVDGKTYTIVSDNLIPNGDFSYDLTGWYNGTGAASTATVNNDGTVTLNNAGSNGGTNSVGALYRAWAINADKMYLFTYTSSASNEYHILSLTDSLNAHSDYETKKLVGSNGSIAVTDAEGTNSFVFVNSDPYDYARIQYRWSGEQTVGNFGLYELASAKVTVNYYYDEAKTELYDSVSKIVAKGDTAEFDAVEVTGTGVVYRAEAKAYEDVQEDAEYNVVLTADYDVTVTIPAVADVTVIEGNDPVLPSTLTLTLTTSAGATTEDVAVDWDTSALEVGENAVYGTLEDYEEKANVNVTVLEEAFGLKDKKSYGAQGTGASVALPMQLYDKFTMEFDLDINAQTDSGVQFSTEAGKFYNNGMLGIGTNGSLTVRGADSQTLFNENLTGSTVRFLVTMDASDDTYTVTATKADGTIATCSGSFRNNSDYISYVSVLRNGGTWADVDDLLAHNIKFSVEPSSNNVLVLEAPAISSALGWDGSKFGIELTLEALSNVLDVISGAKLDDNVIDVESGATVGLSTVNTYKPYTISSYVTICGLTNTAAVTTSVYSEIVDAIAGLTDDSITTNNAAMVSDILTNGGIVITDGALDETQAKIMTLDGTTITLSNVPDKVAFTASTVKVTVDGTEYDGIVSGGGKTVTYAAE